MKDGDCVYSTGLLFLLVSRAHAEVTIISRSPCEIDEGLGAPDAQPRGINPGEPRSERPLHSMKSSVTSEGGHTRSCLPGDLQSNGGEACPSWESLLGIFGFLWV